MADTGFRAALLPRSKETAPLLNPELVTHAELGGWRSRSVPLLLAWRWALECNLVSLARLGRNHQIHGLPSVDIGLVIHAIAHIIGHAVLQDRLAPGRQAVV